MLYVCKFITSLSHTLHAYVCSLCPTYALVLWRCVHWESIDSLQVLRGELVGRSQPDLCLHVSQVDLGGQGTRVIVALLGLVDEGVWGITVSTTKSWLIIQRASRGEPNAPFVWHSKMLLMWKQSGLTVKWFLNKQKQHFRSTIGRNTAYDILHNKNAISYAGPVAQFYCPQKQCFICKPNLVY